MDLSLFVMEYYESGLTPEKVTELFRRDFPPGADEATVALVIGGMCRDGKNCQIDELEAVFEELKNRQQSSNAGGLPPSSPLSLV